MIREIVQSLTRAWKIQLLTERVVDIKSLRFRLLLQSDINDDELSSSPRVKGILFFKFVNEARENISLVSRYPAVETF